MMANIDFFIDAAKLPEFESDTDAGIPGADSTPGKRIKGVKLEFGTPKSGPHAGKQIARVRVFDAADIPADALTDTAGNVITSFAVLARELPEVFDAAYQVAQEVDEEVKTLPYGDWVAAGRPEAYKGPVVHRVKGPKADPADMLPTPGEDTA